MSDPPAGTDDGPDDGGFSQRFGHLATVFDDVALDYARYRPAYPDALYDEICASAGVDLTGAAVLDLAAGSGQFTVGLLARGARVVALDRGRQMLPYLRARLGPVPVACARGEALPLRDGCLDLVTCATGWHWMNLPLAAAEVRRVLRPGGALACCWNFPLLTDTPWQRAGRGVLVGAGLGDVPWARQVEPLENPGGGVDGHGFSVAGSGGGQGSADGHGQVEWRRTMLIEEHVAEIGTHSMVIATGSGRPALLANLRAAIAGAVDGPTVTVTYGCRWFTAIRRP